MQAAVETLDSVWPARPLEYRWKLNGKVAGADSNTRGRVFRIGSSFYADDGAFLFDARIQLVQAVPVLNAHFKRFGLVMHVGAADKPSKTEFMVFPPPRLDVISAAELAPVAADGEGGDRDLNGLLQVPRLRKRHDADGRA